MINDSGILYIEPSARVSLHPIVDQLTRKMTAAFRRSIPGPGYRGFHVCSCGVFSSNCDYKLPNDQITNSLCIHYLAFHREEIPETELKKAGRLDYGEEEPTAEELKAPRR